MTQRAKRAAKRAMIRARVTIDLKEKVKLLASLRSGGSEEEPESLIVREAVAAYVARPDNAELIEKARAMQQEALEAEVKAKEAEERKAPEGESKRKDGPDERS